jgi:hypothetical protein
LVDSEEGGGGQIEETAVSGRRVGEFVGGGKGGGDGCVVCWCWRVRGGSYFKGSSRAGFELEVLVVGGVCSGVGHVGGEVPRVLRREMDRFLPLVYGLTLTSQTFFLESARLGLFLTS